MTIPKPPPPLDISAETKRSVLSAFKRVVENLQDEGKLSPTITATQVLHDPELLREFNAAYCANPALSAQIVVDRDGNAVTQPDQKLVCGITLEQAKQLLVKTCARYLFLGEGEERLVTRTVTTTRFLIFKETQRITERVRDKDPRLLAEILGYIAFDWQLPLLADYADLSLSQLAELGENLLALRTPEAVREVQKFDQIALRRAKAILGREFRVLLEFRPAAIGGALHWPRETYQFFRGIMDHRFFDFMARDEKFFMMVATMERPLIQIYGDVLGYIAKENLIELERLNIDRIEILLATMKAVFGQKMEAMLALPSFAREVLRRQVEGLLHLRHEKAQMAEIHMITWTAIAPNVVEWLARQAKAA